MDGEEGEGGDPGSVGVWLSIYHRGLLAAQAREGGLDLGRVAGGEGVFLCVYVCVEGEEE